MEALRWRELTHEVCTSRGDREVASWYSVHADSTGTARLKRQHLFYVWLDDGGALQVQPRRAPVTSPPTDRRRRGRGGGGGGGLELGVELDGVGEG